MNRFAKKKGVLRFLRKIKFSVVIFLGLIILVLYGLGNVSTMTKEKQAESLRSALNRSIVHCYCVEGTYPPSLDYLIEHYGLTYDTDDFYIDYQPIGGNLKPDVTIIEK